MANEELNGVQKAAILLITLGPEKSAEIFKHLKEFRLSVATAKFVLPPIYATEDFDPLV